ncbi:MAG: NAD(P)H-hydrate dehydratase [Muribaculaceae bacterium]|nr:NAD(P)H-hydrate dehydratase [Muribaculaceae bacterium]
MKIFTTENIREIDRYTIEKEGVSSLELIEQVARGVACEIMSRWRPNKRIAIFAGSGNNGADALATARMLIEEGYRPEVFLFNIGGNRLSGDCIIMRNRLLEMNYSQFVEVRGSFSFPDLNRSHVVIDGLFGSGLREPLTGGFMSLVRYINESGATVVSIDVPSGMFCDWNRGSINRNIIHAHLTLAVQFPRLAFFIGDNADLVGEWKLLDIDLSEEKVRNTPSDYYLVEKEDVRRVLRPRRDFTSKADYGSAMIIAGSYGMMGAAVLAARGALRGGAGKVSVHSARYGYTVMQASVPEALFDADNHETIVTNMLMRRSYSSIAIGPGIGTNENTVKALGAFLASSKQPVVLDADALNCIALQPTLLNHIPSLSVITPHEAEFDRLFGIQPNAESRLIKALEMSKHYNIIIVLKGYYTAVVRPDGRVYFNSSGNPAMATAGSGDVLTGVIAAFIAQGYNPEISALLAVYVHGVAGDIAAEEHGQYGVTAGDIADNIGKAIAKTMK